MSSGATSRRLAHLATSTVANEERRKLGGSRTHVAQLLLTYYFLLLTFNLLLTTYHLPLTTYYLLLTTYQLLLATSTEANEERRKLDGSRTHAVHCAYYSFILLTTHEGKRKPLELLLSPIHGLRLKGL